MVWPGSPGSWEQSVLQTGVSVTLLTIYDMCKAVDKAMEIGDIHLAEKTGGKSGHFVNPREQGGEQV